MIGRTRPTISADDAPFPAIRPGQNEKLERRRAADRTSSVDLAPAGSRVLLAVVRGIHRGGRRAGQSECWRGDKDGVLDTRGQTTLVPSKRSLRYNGASDRMWDAKEPSRPHLDEA
jgi:hypothetical protein